MNFSVGDKITIREDYTRAVTCRPIRYNPGSIYQVVQVKDEPLYPDRPIYYAKCVSTTSEYINEVGNIAEFNTHMPVYDYLIKCGA